MEYEVSERQKCFWGNPGLLQVKSLGQRNLAFSGALLSHAMYQLVAELGTGGEPTL